MEVEIKLAPKYLYSAINMCLNFYVGWGLTYCCTYVDVGITPIPENPLLKFLGAAYFCAQGRCLLISAVTLIFGLKSSYDSIFCVLELFCPNYDGEILSNMSGKHHVHFWHIIVDLCCVGLKLPSLMT